jgi:hypothetical protein
MTFSIEKEPNLDNVIMVTDLNGLQIRYLMSDDGVLRPGRIWSSITPYKPGEKSYSVTFFMYFPDGQPIVLKVEPLS